MCIRDRSTSDCILLTADLLRNSVIVVSSTYLCVKQPGCSASIKMTKVSRPRCDPCGISIREQNFDVLATFSVDICILYAECPPYFYFRFVSSTDLESIPHASTPTSVIPTKFEADMTIQCRVIAFLSADKSRDLVTLTF